MTEAQELNAYPGKTANIFFSGLRAINKLKKDWVGEAEFSLGSISLLGGVFRYLLTTSLLVQILPGIRGGRRYLHV